jgi:hypothetical protein
VPASQASESIKHHRKGRQNRSEHDAVDGSRGRTKQHDLGLAPSCEDNGSAGIDEMAVEEL